MGPLEGECKTPTRAHFSWRGPITGTRFSKRSETHVTDLTELLNAQPHCKHQTETRRAEMPHKPTLTHLCSPLGPRYNLLSFWFFVSKKPSSLAKSLVLHWGRTGLCSPHSSKVSSLILALHNLASSLLPHAHSLSPPCPWLPKAHRTSPHGSSLQSRL